MPPISTVRGIQYIVKSVELMKILWRLLLMTDNLKVLVTTSDKSFWTLRPTNCSVIDSRYLLVLGTRQWPLMITNALRDATDTIDTSDIHPTHLEKIKKWFPKK